MFRGARSSRAAMGAHWLRAIGPHAQATTARRSFELRRPLPFQPKQPDMTKKKPNAKTKPDEHKHDQHVNRCECGWLLPATTAISAVCEHGHEHPHVMDFVRDEVLTPNETELAVQFKCPTCGRTYETASDNCDPDESLLVTSDVEDLT